MQILAPTKQIVHPISMLSICGMQITDSVDALTKKRHLYIQTNNAEITKADI